MTFYTYLHRRNDTGAIFYVGKGKGKRAYDNCHRSVHWLRVSKKHGHTVEIAAQWASEKDAFDHERLLISCFRSMGVCLVNRTDGGDGMSGHTHTVETKAKMRAAAHGKPKTKSAVEKSRFANIGRKASSEAKANMSKARVGRVSSQAAIARQLATNAMPETFARRSAAMKAVLADPAIKARMLESRRTSAAFSDSQLWRLKPIRCIETGVVYPSSVAAAISLGLHASNIRKVCDGQAKTAGGLTFERIEPPPAPGKSTTAKHELVTE